MIKSGCLGVALHNFMKFCEVKNHPLLAEVFDLRTCRIRRSEKFQELIQGGIPLEHDTHTVASEIELAQRFLESGTPCIGKFSAYQPISCRIYPNSRDRLPFHMVASMNRLQLDQMEVIAYPEINRLNDFQKASAESTALYGPGDDHPGSLGVVAFSLNKEGVQIQYAQSSINYRSGSIRNLVDMKLARKYAGWQTEAIKTIKAISAGLGIGSVSAAISARLSEPVKKALAELTSL